MLVYNIHMYDIAAPYTVIVSCCHFKSIANCFLATRPFFALKAAVGHQLTDQSPCIQKVEEPLLRK